MATGSVRVVALHTGVNFLLDTFVEGAKISNFNAAQIDEYSGYFKNGVHFPRDLHH